MTNKIDSTTTIENTKNFQSNEPLKKSGVNKWTVVGGGAFVGMITALAIGLIFGPIAAIICFCVASIGSALHAAFVAKQCKHTVSISPQNENPEPLSKEKQSQARRNLDEARRIQESW